MNRTRVWKITGMMLLVFGLQLLCGLESYAAPVGTFTSFDAPGAGTSPYLGTFSVAINPGGSITGYYYDANGAPHGFVRAANGTITPFDAPGAGGDFGTAPFGINAPGVVTGYFGDANNVLHGFIRATNGTITPVDDPNADTSAFQGTFAVGVNPQGTIVGCFSSNNGIGGFLRTADGSFSTLNPPGSGNFSLNFCYSYISFLPTVTINNPGVITGASFLPLPNPPNLYGGNYRGFVRALDGTYTGFDAVSSPSSPCCTWTFPTSINSAGEIVGFDNDFHSVYHGFLRASNGAITLFNAPNAGSRRNQGTLASSVNPAGVITGYYTDANNVSHGFVFRPQG